MKTLLAILAIILLIYIGAIYLYSNRLEPVLKTNSPYTQDEPQQFINGCGEGITDCKG